MKLVSHYLDSIKNVEIFPIISIFIFLIVFAFIIVWAVKYDKKVVKDMKDLPLDNGDHSQN